MKKRILAAAAALTAAAMLSATSFADDGQIYDFSDTVENCGESWRITEKGIKLIQDDVEIGWKVFSLGLTFEEAVNDGMILHFDFYAGNAVYELDYIMMLPLYSAEDDEPTIYLYADDVMTALADKYSYDKNFDISAIDGMKVTDNVTRITGLELTDKKCAPSLAGHIWNTFEKDDEGNFTKQYMYYIFNSDGKSGRTSDPETGYGSPFMYEQDDEQFLISFGGVDDHTPATIKIGKNGEIIGVFGYGANVEIIKELSFVPVFGEDPETFGIIDYEQPDDFQTDGDKWMLSDAGTNLSSLNGTAGGNAGFVIEFDKTLSDGFDLEFEFRTDEGKTVRIPARSDGALETNTLYITARDLLYKADISPDSVSEFSIKSGRQNINTITLGTGTRNSTPVKFAGIDTQPSAQVSEAADSDNPPTGTATALGLVLVSGAAALISSKKRRN